MGTRRLVRQYVAIGFGFSAFTIAFLLGSAVTMSTGIPLLGGVINGVLVSMVLTIGLLAVDRFWTATLMWFVFGLFATMTTTLGPPGLYKIPIGIVAGLIWDAIYFGLRRRTVGLFAGALVGAMAIMLLMLGALYLGFGRDAAAALEKYSSALSVLVAVNLAVTALGVFLGRQAYRTRLSRLQLFRNLKFSPEPEDTNGGAAED